MKIVSALMILMMLSGCWCITDTEDSSSVSEYFSGCWENFSGKAADTNKANTDNINKEK